MVAAEVCIGSRPRRIYCKRYRFGSVKGATTQREVSALAEPKEKRKKNMAQAFKYFSLGTCASTPKVLGKFQNIPEYSEPLTSAR